MTGFRFLHLADLHLETNFGGRANTRERLRRAALKAFETAVDFAIDNHLHAVLAAGDLYDDPLLSLGTQLALDREIERLDEAGIWFLAVCGNHDPGGSRYRSARLGLETDAHGAPRPRVHIFRDRHPVAVDVTDPGGQAVGVVVGAGHVTDAESANLAAQFPRIKTSLPVAALLHTHVDSARTASHHDRYAPSGQKDFEQSNYSYWALGHIHTRQRAVPDQPVYYAGNLQGRNPRETGEKGGLVVEAHPGVPADPQFVRFAPVRWEHLRADDLPPSNAPAVLVAHLGERIEALRSRSDELVVRVELAGETPMAPTLRNIGELKPLEEELADRTGVLEVQLRTEGLMRPVDRMVLRESPSAVARALQLIERAAQDDALLDEVAPESLAGNDDPDERRDYLRGLLSDLPEELIERSLELREP